MTWRTLLGIFLFALGIVGAAYTFVRHRQFGEGEVVVAGKVTVQVKVAATDATREKGLSGHKPLAADQGMWFVFAAPGRQSFWMKDMEFPIDIIWVHEGKIVDIAARVPPPADLPAGQPLPLYRPIVAADRVLEVQSGFAQQHGLKAGDGVEFYLR